MDIITQPRLNYHYGETLDLTDTVLHIVWNDGEIDVCTYWDFDNHVIYTSIDNGTILGPSHDGVRIFVDHVGSFAPNWTEPLEVVPLPYDTPMVSLNLITPPRLEYQYGETLDLTDIVVNLVWSDGPDEVCTYWDFENFGIMTNVDHGTTLDHSHNGIRIMLDHADSYSPNWTEPLMIMPSVVYFQVSSLPKLEYVFGESLDLDNMIVEIYWSNGSLEHVDHNSFESCGLSNDPMHGSLLTHDHPLTIRFDRTGYFTGVDILRVENYHCVGHVKDRFGNPLADVQIFLNGQSMVRSDAYGDFEFYAAPVDGPVTITAHKEGYKFRPMQLPYSSSHAVGISAVWDVDTVSVGLMVSASVFIYIVLFISRRRNL